VSAFLEKVLQEKARELEAKRKARPLKEIERAAAGVPVRGFRSALEGRGRIIAEIKGRSPSVASFRQQGAPERLAGIYERNGASAISIVTDERNFGTSLKDVERVRAASTLPVLVKDFIVDPYQVVEARAHGADAVLLIARILSPGALERLLEHAGKLGMDALTECHDEEDIDKARSAGAGIIGINNRDLRTLEVSLDATRRLVPRIPERALCVSESGIDRRDQVEELSELGVEAFLIGGALLSAEDPAAKLRELAGLPQDAEGKGGAT
jgi:indole-3-glycerol phosphate synthase